MDKLTRYRNYIHQVLEPYTHHHYSYANIEVQLLEDTARDHYQVYHIGWHGKQRVHGCILHLDIINDKIWIQHNMTEDLIAEKLEKLGVPKQDIVLGLHAPIMRQYTDYAME